DNHWTGQVKPALSEGSVQEVSVNVEEVRPLPRHCMLQPGGTESNKVTNDGHIDKAEQNTQSEDANVEEQTLSCMLPFALREETNIEVHVEIEVQPRDLSGTLWSKSLSMESLSLSGELTCTSQQSSSSPEQQPLPELQRIALAIVLLHLLISNAPSHLAYDTPAHLGSGSPAPGNFSGIPTRQVCAPFGKCPNSGVSCIGGISIAL
ncbi:hypothetical protein DNTS_020844, partial [Danionella cerebrum]